MTRYDFANVLLGGPCNLRCPSCIGTRLAGPSVPSTLARFPLPGQQRLVREVRRFAITEISLTGLDTDPGLYRYQRELIGALRGHIPGVRLSLHTNARLVLRDPTLLNAYDRATLSIPSLVPATYQAMTGSPTPPPLERIVQAARIPLKVSVLVTGENVAEIRSLLDRFRDLGIRRVVLRRPRGVDGPWPPPPHGPVVRWFAGNPVFDLDGLEVTTWDFALSTLRCLNLYPDGTLGVEYLLSAPQRAARHRLRARAGCVPFRPTGAGLLTG